MASFSGFSSLPLESSAGKDETPTFPAATDGNSIDWGSCYVIRSSAKWVGFPNSIDNPFITDEHLGGHTVIMGQFDPHESELRGERIQQLGVSLSNHVSRLLTIKWEASQLHLHDFIQAGIPRYELVKTFRTFPFLSNEENMSNVLGVSSRTLQRMESTGDKNLSTEQASRLISFVKIMSLATQVLGGKKQAEDWLQRKAIALDQRRPIDLLTTDVGAQAVQTLLEQIDAGVYV
jgi:putative toxin-antitoxin system antitoxin component (TIGR02293 family)